MAITNKLITFNKLTSFETQLAQGNILETSIVFIKDAKKIWTKGTYFDCSGGGSNNIAVYETTDDVYNGVLNDNTYELSSILRNENIHTVIIIQKMEVNTTTDVRTFVFNACDRREPGITITFTCLYSEANAMGNTTNLIFYQIAKTEGAGIKLNKQPIALKSDIPNTDDFVLKSEIPAEVTESTVSGWGFTKNTGTITSISANGTSIATSGVANIPAASTSKYGVTKLNSSTSSTSTTEAATPSAVKAAYDLANSYKGTITAVDTGDAIDDVNTEYATVAYVDGLVGDINSVLESIING